MPVKQTKKKYLKPRIFVEDYLEELCEDDIKATSTTQSASGEPGKSDGQGEEAKDGGFGLDFGTFSDDYDSESDELKYEIYE